MSSVHLAPIPRHCPSANVLFLCNSVWPTWATLMCKCNAALKLLSVPATFFHGQIFVLGLTWRVCRVSEHVSHLSRHSSISAVPAAENLNFFSFPKAFG